MQNNPLIQLENANFSYSLVSVIFLGIPLDRTGTVGVADFFKLEAASMDFCTSSALRAADLGFLFRVKCLTTEDCWPEKELCVS